jgi:hypothetical protein
MGPRCRSDVHNVHHQRCSFSVLVMAQGGEGCSGPLSLL